MTLSLTIVKQAEFALHSDNDLATARQVVRDWARELGLSVLDLTRIVTAASELARNAVVHGGGGVMYLQVVRRMNRQGLRLTFQDRGPGIPEIDRAMQDGYTTGDGMGIGLPGAKRLVNEFDLSSTPSDGTRVTVVRWKP